MRLINSTTFELRKFDDDNDIPPYAIMSHTWRKDEVSLQDMAGLDESWKQKAGFQKIRYCCEQAVRDELKWAWVDTCCIDQSNSAELSKSINSMFRFYSRAKLCYAYLADISSDDPKKLRNSKWFTRGWTLQELIAPSNVIFYNASWTAIGTKRDLMHEISDITHIDEVVLGGGDLERVSVARKMSWAATRITTILEDMAYCLLGIFNVNMPLLYGEGERAFIRLQKHILEVSFDQSLFAWGVEIIGNMPHSALSGLPI
ncbi:HET-domain-containing protein [Glonium stellatum]|uniref:HET-domain-containing protein n=1 Tax=Glonium stellatum TaxID=574774 RepID=A0A8E2JTK2_9PEZI|nr:HET-domain-containing protein [Glonium stellatum]